LTGTVSAASLFLGVSCLLALSADLRCFFGEYVWGWLSMIFLERGGGGGGGGGEEFGAGLSGLGSRGRLEMRRIAWKAGETVTALYIFSYTTLGQLLLLLFLSMVFVKDTK
jgi:hypothetical protein